MYSEKPFSLEMAAFKYSDFAKLHSHYTSWAREATTVDLIKKHYLNEIA